jgi:hypothetical protein
MGCACWNPQRQHQPVAIVIAFHEVIDPGVGGDATEIRFQLYGIEREGQTDAIGESRVGLAGQIGHDKRPFRMDVSAFRCFTGGGDGWEEQ